MHLEESRKQSLAVRTKKLTGKKNKDLKETKKNDQLVNQGTGIIGACFSNLENYVVFPNYVINVGEGF